MTIEDQLQRNFSLKNHNTFGLDVQTAYFFECSDLEGLRSVIVWSNDKNISRLILGGGSNVLLINDFSGVVINNSLKGCEIVNETTELVDLKIGSGEVWHEVVMKAVENDWGGIENLSLIPGSVGAAPMQNIGAYGVEIKDVFLNLDALNLETLEVESFTNEQCQFGYRESVFKHEFKGKYMIVSVTLRLSKKHSLNLAYGAINETLQKMNVTNPTVKDVSEAVIQIRQSKLPDPAEIGNSGSFFKNPVISAEHFEELKLKYPQIPSYLQVNGDVKVPAGWLIEQCGWKGKRRGDIGVHDKQALVLVNYGGGKGADLWQLALDIQSSVKEAFNIELQPEVNVI